MGCVTVKYICMQGYPYTHFRSGEAFFSEGSRMYSMSLSRV